MNNNSKNNFKILYAMPKNSLTLTESNQQSSVTINDLLKSAQILEDAADKVVPTKKCFESDFGKLSNKFITFSALDKFNKKISDKFTNTSVDNFTKILHDNLSIDLKAEGSSIENLEGIPQKVFSENNGKEINKMDNEKSDVISESTVLVRESELLISAKCNKIIDKERNHSTEKRDSETKIENQHGECDHEIWIDHSQFASVLLPNVSRPTISENIFLKPEVIKINEKVNNSVKVEEYFKDFTYSQLFNEEPSNVKSFTSAETISEINQHSGNIITANDLEVLNDNEVTLKSSELSRTVERISEKDINSDGFEKTQPSLFLSPVEQSSVENKSLDEANFTKSFGFSTAGGKSVKIDEKCLDKARLLLRDDLEKEIEELVPIKSNLNMPSSSKGFGFSTAGGKSVKIDEKCLDKARLLLRDDLEKEIEEMVPIKSNLNMPSSSKGFGFSTAGGKSVKIDEKCLDKARLLLRDDLEKEIEEMVPIKSNLNMPSSSKGFGFSTAGGKSVKIDEKCLDKARLLLRDDLEKEIEEMVPIKSNLNMAPPSKGFGFSTARGKSVKVDEKCLDKARLLLKDDLEKGDELLSLKTSKSSNLNMPSSSKSFGFSTAGGKSVKIDEKCLDKARLLLRDDLEKENEETAPIKSNLNMAPPSKGFGFSTARGKSVKVDEKYLDKARLLLKDDLEKGDEELLSLKTCKSSNLDMPSSSKSFGFSTAGGKSVKVDEKCLDKARLLLKDDLEKGDGELLSLKTCKSSNLNMPSSSKSFGFSTAGGKSVKVDEKCLDKARLLLKDDLEKGDGELLSLKTCKSSNLNMPSSSKSFGFSTAGGKSVKVDEKCLDKARLLLKDDLEKENEELVPIKSNLNMPSSSKDFAFSTAGGKSVKVDEKCLDKARLLLKDDLEKGDGELLSLKTSKSSNLNMPSSSKSFGFSTAGGKSVKVNEKCLDKARLLLKDDLEKENEELVPIKSNLNMPSSSKDFAFSTAGGKSVKIDEKCLDKARVLFQEDSNFDEKSSKKENALFCDDLTVASNRENLMNSPNRNEPINSSVFIQNMDIGSETLNNIFLLNETVCRKTFDSVDFNFDGALENDRINKVVSSENALNETPNTSETNRKTSEIYKKPHCNVKLDFKETIPKSQTDNSNNNFLDNGENEAVVPNIDHSKVDNNFSNNVHLEKDTDKKINNDKMDEHCTDMSGLSDMREAYESVAAFVENGDISCFSPCRIQPIITSPSMNSERLRPNDSLVSLNDSQESDFCTITRRMANFAYTPKREKRKSVAVEEEEDGGTEADENYSKKPKIGIFTEDEILVEYKTAVQRQKDIISEKQNKTIKPQPGELFLQKQSGERISLEKVGRPKIFSEKELLNFGVKREIIEISSNPISFQFDASDYSNGEITFYSTGLHISGDSYLIFNPKSKSGIDEIEQCFLTFPGVDPKLIPDGWILNHYRWIVWKLASMEKSFPDIFAGRYLTPYNVLNQLKYRYDREIDRAHRSAFKKISECDESPSRLFVCCIATIRKNNIDSGDSNYDLELTDGWYSIWALADQEMVEFIKKGLIKIGTKLAIMGAELINPEQPCDPLKAGKETRMKFYTNSCRRVKWNAKMGFLNKYRLPAMRLSSILPNGGFIGDLKAVVARVYPILHMSKDSEGKTVFRNERAESIEVNRNERNYNKQAEALYETIWKQVEVKYKNETDVGNITLKEVATITQPDVLWSVIEKYGEQGMLSDEQIKLASDYHEKIQLKIRAEVKDLIEEKMKELIPKRKVTNLLKVRLIDCDKEIQAVLTVWRPTEDICNILKENKFISFSNLTATGLRERILQLTNTRHTRYEEINENFTKKYQRNITSLTELKSSCTSKPLEFLAGEIDIVGVVIHIKKPDRPKGPTTVYITNLDEEFLAISFWTALKVFGCEDILTEDSLVCCYNLQWRRGSGAWRIPNVFATELSVFSQHPKYTHSEEAFSNLKSVFNLKKSSDQLAEHKLRLFTILKKRDYASTGRCSPTPTGASPWTSGGAVQYTPEPDTDSTPVQRKIRKLSNYGRPPLLTPLPLFAKTPEISSNFRSPCRTVRSPSVGSSPLSLDSQDT